MKKLLTSLAILTLVTSAAFAAGPVYINEVLSNPAGADAPNEYIELRGTPNMSLAGYCILSLEGQHNGAPKYQGDIQAIFLLDNFSLGANGYLFLKQGSSQYTVTDPNTTVLANTDGNSGWGANGTSTVGYWCDTSGNDLENQASTILLVKVDAGAQGPLLTIDLDTNDDGTLELPAGWTIIDSVGIMDGAGASAVDLTYGAINFRVPGGPGETYVGTSMTGPVIDISGPMTTTSGTFYVGRKGESTGSTANDWVGAIVEGTAASPLAFAMYSASDPAYSGMKLSDMVYGGTNAIAAPVGSLGYTPTINGTRFTNYTHLPIGGPVGGVAVDPRDDTTILFTMDSATGGGIYRAYKVASGNWWVDSTPVVSGLDRPSALNVTSDGTIWWVHAATMSLKRLIAPWEAHTPETVITNFAGLTDDDPVDVAVAPSTFTGSLGQPGSLVIADRGSDDDAYNAVYLQDPATPPLDQLNNTFLVPATTAGLGWDNLVAIGGLPQSGEVVTLSVDGFITAINGDGTTRSIVPSGVTIANAQGLAVDPQTGRVWVSDDTLDEIWSVDPSPAPTASTKELSFPLSSPPVSYRQINFHNPGMAFSTNGSFLVISDTSTSAGGGRLIVFHSEPYTPVELAPFSVTNVTMTAQGPKLDWSSAGIPSLNLKYVVQRSLALGSTPNFSTIAIVTETSYTDTAAPAGEAFYRVMAKP